MIANHSPLALQCLVNTQSFSRLYLSFKFVLHGGLGFFEEFAIYAQIPFFHSKILEPVFFDDILKKSFEFEDGVVRQFVVRQSRGDFQTAGSFYKAAKRYAPLFEV